MDANAGLQPNCLVLRSPTSRAERPGPEDAGGAASEAHKLRLKQLHWDKLKQAREGTVWSRAKGDKLHLDLDQLESLFQVGGRAGGVGGVCGGVRCMPGGASMVRLAAGEGRCIV